ncbi:MAG: hypothetical protein K0R48_187 [Gammaproteobacteria bacterium]|jgi:hypothetical protein|nr:hypothetical protein [Gammaproteobacteria bacterium]
MIRTYILIIAQLFRINSYCGAATLRYAFTTTVCFKNNVLNIFIMLSGYILTISPRSEFRKQALMRTGTI